VEVTRISIEEKCMTVNFKSKSGRQVTQTLGYPMPTTDCPKRWRVVTTGRTSDSTVAEQDKQEEEEQEWEQKEEQEEENERISAEDASDLDELEREETIRNEIDTSIAESEHRTSATEEHEQSNEAYVRMYENYTSEPQGSCSGNECYDCDYCWDMRGYDERRRLDDQREAVDAGMTERRERCPSRPTRTCSMEDRQECDYCFIRDIENIDDLHAAIQHDDRDAILQGRQQSRSSQIDSNIAIIAYRGAKDAEVSHQREASRYRTLFSCSVQYEFLERSFHTCNSSVEFQLNCYLAHISNM
jgi:hypothetical protein